MKKMTRFSTKAQGNSMFPLLQDGDIVEYIHTPFHDIYLNDIVLMHINNILITHRVIYKTIKTCITRGDNNTKADPEIKKGRVLAKVIRFKRKGTWHDIQDVYHLQSGFYLHEIQKLATLLHIQKLPHAFLKGVLVSLRYEGTIPKRIYADCDILVPQGSYRNVENVFALLGYKPLALAENDSIPYFKKVNQQPEVSFMKMIRGVPVNFDLHFEPVFLMSRLAGLDLFYPKKLLYSLTNSILTRSSLIKIKGFSYSLCSVSDQILYLALHIFHHNFTDSPRYQLLDSVIRKRATKKEWRDLRNTVKKYRLEGYVYLVFIFLKKYFKTPIPSSFLSAIEPLFVKKKISHLFLERIDIFSQDNRVHAGVSRFIFTFILSPNLFLQKILLFFHPEVVYLGSRLTLTRITSFFSQIEKKAFKT